MNTGQSLAGFQFKIFDLFGLMTFVAIMIALGLIPEDYLTTEEDGTWTNHRKDFYTLVTFSAAYAAKFWVMFRFQKSTTASIVFALIMAALVPFVYWRIVYWGPHTHMTTLGKLVIYPVGILAVPVASFVIFDVRDRFCRIPEVIIRTLIEVLVVTPVWWYIWAWMFLCLGLAWI